MISACQLKLSSFSSCMRGFMSTAATLPLLELLLVRQAHEQQMIIEGGVSGEWGALSLICGVMILSLK